jgi:hypothetical protein
MLFTRNLHAVVVSEEINSEAPRTARLSADGAITSLIGLGPRAVDREVDGTAMTGSLQLHVSTSPE